MSSTPLDLSAIARRAAGRALGLAPGDEAPAAVRAAIQVDAAATLERPGPRPAAGSERVGAELATLAGLRAVADGGRLALSPDARVTETAREEAFRRGIRLERRQAGGARAADGGPLRVAVGSDHGGFGLKRELVRWLAELGHRVLDLGTHDTAACDYPVFAQAVARAVGEGNADIGVVIDGAGIGSAMVANKIAGVLAANCWCEAAARNAREHNHANVLTLGAGMLDAPTAERVLRAFLATPVGPGRHARRAQMIRELDSRPARRASSLPEEA